MRLALGPEVVAQVVERVEQEEMGAGTAPACRPVRDGGYASNGGPFSSWTNWYSESPSGCSRSRQEDLPGEVEAVVEVGSHGARLASGVGRGWGRRRFVRRSAEQFGVLAITGQR